MIKLNRIILDAEQAQRDESLNESLRRLKGETFMRSNRAANELLKLADLLGEQCEQDDIKITLTNIAYELGRIKQSCM